MIKKITIVIALLLVGCNFETPTQFSEKALNDKIYDINGNSYVFKEVINAYRGKKIVIDFWASWCKDCVKGMPKVKELQKNFPEVVFLFLSVDKDKTSWKKGIEKYQMQGKHYNLPKGMKTGDLVKFVNLGWIPRYLVIDENQNITLFKATKATDKKITQALKK